MGEENKSWYEISERHLNDMIERKSIDSAYSHYDSLINDHVLDKFVDKDEIKANEDELEELFEEENPYDREPLDNIRKR